MLPEQILKNDVLEKLYSFCAYQERSKQEVRNKLSKLAILPKFHGDYITLLEEEKFINEERFAQAFVRGKLRANKWGRVKIRQGLVLKGVDRNLIDEALRTIDMEFYMDQLNSVIEKKKRTIKDTDPRIIKHKILQHCAGKGFELNEIYTALDNL